LLVFFSYWHSAYRADSGRNSCLESSTQRRNQGFRLVVFDCARLSAFNSMVETNVITWLLVLLIALSVAILITHAIDAMRS